MIRVNEGTNKLTFGRLSYAAFLPIYGIQGFTFLVLFLCRKFRGNP